MVFRIFKRKKEKLPALSRSEFLQMKPVRNPALKWEKNKDGVITLIVSLKKAARKGILLKMASPPKEKKIELDKIGSTIWEICDGSKTVKDIIKRLYEEYKIMPIEAEVSLNTYFTDLSKRGLLGFIVPEEARVRLEQSIKNKKKKK